MSTLSDEILLRYKRARILAKCGATLSSILLYPIRHRLPTPRNQIELRNGLSFVSPLSEPLVELLEDMWIKQCYTPGDFRIAAGDTVVDIGANIGVFSVWAATRAEGVRVVALEPSPRTFQSLVANLSRNGLGQVIAVQAACGGRKGTAVLYSRGFELGNTLSTRDIWNSVFRPLAEVDVLTIDDVFRRYGVEVCNLLKIECEGAEYEILFNASEGTLQKVRKLSVEYHLGLNDHFLEELLGFLEQRGFKVTYTPVHDEEAGHLYAIRGD